MTPLTFLERTASIFPDHTAIVYDDWKGRLGSSGSPAFVQTWAETAERVTRLASALSGVGVGRGDTVAILSPNTPAYVEAHHGVNAVGAVLNPLNTRLDAATLAWADFRGKVLGPTDPSTAPPDSLRGTLHTDWEKLGLTAPPNTGDNGVHASASQPECSLPRSESAGASAGLVGPSTLPRKSAHVRTAGSNSTK